MTEERRPGTPAVYVISVAAELAGMHPQTLRVYERKGLLQPQRTSGNTRRYSVEDIARLRRIQELTQAGVNLAGARMVLHLEEQLALLVDRMSTLEAEMSREMRRASQRAGDIVPARSNRSLQQMWSEAQRKDGRPIEMGPAKER